MYYTGKGYGKWLLATAQQATGDYSTTKVQEPAPGSPLESTEACPESEEERHGDGVETFVCIYLQVLGDGR